MAARGSHALSKASKAIRGPSGLFFGAMQGSLYSEKVMSKCTLSSCRSAKPHPIEFSSRRRKRTLYRRFRELAWVGGCVTAPAAWASGPSTLASRGPWGRRRRGTRSPARPRARPWGRRSVHRLAKMTSRSCFGSFVYTVATREGRARVAPPPGWRLCRGSNPHKPPRSPL